MTGTAARFILRRRHEESSPPRHAAPRARRHGDRVDGRPAAVSGGKIVRVETDADGNAAYEAHMTKADGTPVTVYVDESFEVVSVESR